LSHRRRACRKGVQGDEHGRRIGHLVPIWQPNTGPSFQQGKCRSRHNTGAAAPAWCELTPSVGVKGRWCQRRHTTGFSRIPWVLFGIQNRTLGLYLTAIKRIRRHPPAATNSSTNSSSVRDLSARSTSMRLCAQTECNGTRMLWMEILLLAAK
jgi:hypothetical protein